MRLPAFVSAWISNRSQTRFPLSCVQIQKPLAFPLHLPFPVPVPFISSNVACASNLASLLFWLRARAVFVLPAGVLLSRALPLYCHRQTLPIIQRSQLIPFNCPFLPYQSILSISTEFLHSIVSFSITRHFSGPFLFLLCFLSAFHHFLSLFSINCFLCDLLCLLGVSYRKNDRNAKGICRGREGKGGRDDSSL